MRLRVNLISLCLLSMFIVIFGSILVMPLLGDGTGAPTEVSVGAVAATPDQ